MPPLEIRHQAIVAVQAPTDAIVLANEKDIAEGDVTSPGGVVVPLGGDYQVSVQATEWGGGTLTLKGLGPKRTSWRAFGNGGVVFTGDGDRLVGLTDGATLRGEVTGGAILGLTVVLGRLSS